MQKLNLLVKKMKRGENFKPLNLTANNNGKFNFKGLEFSKAQAQETLRNSLGYEAYFIGGL